MSDTRLFRRKAPGIMRKLRKDFDIKVLHAAAILGNIGTECDGFHHLQQQGVPEGTGGYGWAQWSGARRTQFFNWCKKRELKPQSDKANYGFLRHELKTTYRNAISAIVKTNKLPAAVRAFERAYEQAGSPNYPSRNRWARIALDEYD